MGIDCTSSPSRAIKSSAMPVALPFSPFTIGAWVRPTLTSFTSKDAWGLWASSSQGFALAKDTGDHPGLWVGSALQISATTAFALSTWAYMIGRAVANNSSRLAVRHQSGLVEHGSVGSAVSIGTPDTMVAGASISGGNYWDGQVAEAWIADIDIQADGAQLSDQLLHQLAFGGPFSVPHIIPALIEYKSFRADPLGMGEGGDNFIGKQGELTYSSIGASAPTLGIHPPLPYWYKRPVDFTRNVIV